MTVYEVHNRNTGATLVVSLDQLRTVLLAAVGGGRTAAQTANAMVYRAELESGKQVRVGKFDITPLEAA